jgi:hypothetical protein
VIQPPPNPGRWWKYARKRQLPCPGGHALPETFTITEDGFTRCEKRLARGQPCGRWIYMFSIRGGGCIVAEVQLNEKRIMETLTTPAEMLEYLDVFPK